MLVYTRKDSSGSCNGTVKHKANGDDPKATTEIPTPPPRVLDLINSFNAAHDQACEAHAEKSEHSIAGIVLILMCFLDREKEGKLRFDALRRKVMNIYRSWSLSNTNEVRATCPWSDLIFKCFCRILLLSANRL
jgi:ubiquitin carboxyl-terminal hydrolase 48